MTKKVENTSFWGVVWRFLGGNIILLSIGMVLVFKNKEAINIITGNMIVIAVFVSNCYKRKKMKMNLKPSIIYLIILCISCYMIYDMSSVNSATAGFLQYLICLMWIFKFASPDLDVIKEKGN